MSVPTKEQTKFPRAIAAKYRITRINLAPGEREERIEFNNHRGFAYIYSDTHAGFWINTGKPASMIKKIQSQLIGAVIMQVGDTELTFTMPFKHCLKALQLFKGKKKYPKVGKNDPRLAALANGRAKLKAQRD